MDKDELLVFIAQSFIEEDLSNSPIIISRVNDNYASIIFGVENNDTLLQNKQMICNKEIDAEIDLLNESIRIDNIDRNGWILTNADGSESTSIWEDRKSDYYMVVTGNNKKYLYCESYISRSYVESNNTKNGVRGHDYYEENKHDKSRIEVVDEYSLTDGYPVSKALKSFTKVYYNMKKSGD